MPRELNAKVVEEMASRISEIDRNLTLIDKGIEEATWEDRKSGLRRTLSITLGVPCGLVAFFLLGFYYPLQGRGLYPGIGFSVAAFILSRIGLSTPARLVPRLEVQRRSLVSMRQKFQTQIQAYAGDKDEDSAEEAV